MPWRTIWSCLNTKITAATSGRRVNKKIESDRWYGLKVELNGRTIKGYLDEALILTYETATPLKGHTGLWTKADSVTWFRNFTRAADGKRKYYPRIISLT